MNFKNDFWEPFRKSRIYKPFIIIAGSLFLIIILDTLIMPLYVRRWQEIELPDVVELSAYEAQARLEKEGFIGVIADSVYNASYSIGTVVEQNPAPYSTVKSGRHVYLTVSIGEKPILMPNLFYKSPREAELILNSYGLILNGKYYEYSDLSPEGVVIAQSFPQGQVIRKGMGVSITICLGAMSQKRTIPQLVGKSLDDARKMLELLGIANIEIIYQTNNDMLPQTVISQSAPAGSPIITDMSLELTISSIDREEE
jgi:serine/threonine-protein kinase